MVNVDRAERLWVSSIVQPELAFDNTKILAELPDENKHIAFRGTDHHQILAIRQNLLNLMMKTWNVQTLSFSSSNNNRSNWDLYENILDNNAELKLGSATDAALGMSHINTIFGTEAAELFPSIQDRLSWRPKYLENPAEQRILYINKLRETAKGLNALMPINSPITRPQTIHSLNMLYANINHQEMMDSIAAEIITVPDVYRFSVSPKGTWRQDIRPALTSDNTWIFNGAEVTGTGRLNIKFSNGIYAINFIYNQKNPYRYSKKEFGELKAPGIYGLGTPSMNVKISRIPTPKVSSIKNNSEKLLSDRIKP